MRWAPAVVLALLLGACSTETTTSASTSTTSTTVGRSTSPASFDLTFADPQVKGQLTGFSCEGVAGRWTATLALSGEVQGQGTTSWQQPETGTAQAVWNFRLEAQESAGEYTGTFTVEVVGPPKAPALAFNGTGRVANAFTAIDVPQEGIVPLRFGPTAGC